MITIADFASTSFETGVGFGTAAISGWVVGDVGELVGEKGRACVDSFVAVGATTITTSLPLDPNVPASTAMIAAVTIKIPPANNHLPLPPPVEGVAAGGWVGGGGGADRAWAAGLLGVPNS